MNLHEKMKPVYALGGDALTSPEHTETSFWSALGGGAGGMVTGIRLSKNGVVVCANYDTFEKTCGDTRAVKDMTWDEISQLDAGFTFRSTVLNDNNQPTGEVGKDKPWEGNLPKKRALRVPRLDQILILFSRRCHMMLWIPDSDHQIIDAAVSVLETYGVVGRVSLIADYSACTYIKGKYPGCRCVLAAPVGEDPIKQVQIALQMGIHQLYLDWDDACESDGGTIKFRADLENELTKTGMNIFLGSDTMVFAPKPAYINAIRSADYIDGIIARGILPTVESLTPPALIGRDDFKGTYIDRRLWSAGYSHINQDTLITQDDGIQIEIKDGGSYSGAAAVCLIPLHGRLDAQVDFQVDNPQQGTTFEMAAICIDPGYFHMDNTDLNTRNVNLTFDVHGAPPYASSERDENDGFRCGWNNGFNLTKVESDWEAASVNMYNKYGRDVGNGDADNPQGTLRLIRNGSVFSTYYKDKYNDVWVCSGTMLVQNMSNDVYIRLAAKHWGKGGKKAPGNHIRFNNFKLYQF